MNCIWNALNRINTNGAAKTGKSKASSNENKPWPSSQKSFKSQKKQRNALPVVITSHLLQFKAGYLALSPCAAQVYSAALIRL